MQRVGLVRSSVLVDVVNYVGLPLMLAYGYSMYLHPWFAGRASWDYVQLVWDRWQTLNAGALAFLASLVAFNITRYNENQQRARDFVAAKAFLPAALSSLVEYFKSSAAIYTTLWNAPVGAPPIGFEPPKPPSDYREVFSACIRHADPAVGNYLSRILNRLQVHDARLRDAALQMRADAVRVTDKHTLIAYAMKLGELQALVSNLFAFARSERHFDEKPLTWEDFRGAYAITDLEADDFYIDETMNLVAFTQRWIQRTGGAPTGDA